MSRKKKPRAKQAVADKPEDLAYAAADQLAQGRFKDAVTAYKQLLKKERRPEWVEELARAYAGRAQHLASRGMIKEAIAVWQTRADTCDKPLADPCYLQWLIAADRTQEIARLYRQDTAALADADSVAALQARLATAALADGGGLIGQLPVDDSVVRDFAAANTALTAYAEGDDETLQAALARITFRSPYRDFSQLLKALLRYEREPTAAAQLIARVPADTPFADILRALEQAGKINSGEPADVQTLAALPTGAQDLLAALLGWSPEQQKLLGSLAQLDKGQATQRALLDFVLAHHKVLGEDYARVAAFILAGNDAQMHRHLRKLYHDLPEAEIYRLLALGNECDGEIEDAIYLWRKMLEVMNTEPGQEATGKLRRALIHRHIADLIQPQPMSLPLDAEVIEHLTVSLEFDVADQASTLWLVDHYLHAGDLKNARHWVDQALARFPKDPDCLFKAAETAVAGKAFKKAADFAQRILAIDPINANARGLLVDSHLGHARKQIKAHKPEAARRELSNAADFARSAIDTARVALLEGLVTFACDDAKAAAQALAAGVEHAGDALVGRFLLLLEAHRVGQKLTSVSRASGLPAIKTLGERKHVLALVDTLGTLRADQIHKPAAEAALQALAPAFNEAASINLDRGRAEQVCETLLRYRQYAPLQRYAHTALLRWIDDPLFTFYWVMGRIKEGFLNPLSQEQDRLEKAFQDAQDAGDNQTAQRIAMKLRKMLSPFNPVNPDAFDLFEDDMMPDIPLDPDIDDVGIESLYRLMETHLTPEDIKRLEEAARRGRPIPLDIAAKVVSLLGSEFGSPPPKEAGSGKKKR